VAAAFISRCGPDRHAASHRAASLSVVSTAFKLEFVGRVEADKVTAPHTTALQSEAEHTAKNAALVKESNRALS
jgi:hypothetical protein